MENLRRKTASNIGLQENQPMLLINRGPVVYFLPKLCSSPCPNLQVLGGAMEEEGSIGDVETFYKDKTVFITGATGFMGKVGNIF